MLLKTWLAVTNLTAWFSGTAWLFVTNLSPCEARTVLWFSSSVKTLTDSTAASFTGVDPILSCWLLAVTSLTACTAWLDCARVNSLPSAVWNSWPCWRLAFTAKNLPSLCWTREGDCTDEGELRAKDEDVPVAGLEAWEWCLWTADLESSTEWEWWVTEPRPLGDWWEWVEERTKAEGWKRNCGAEETRRGERRRIVETS